MFPSDRDQIVRFFQNRSQNTTKKSPLTSEKRERCRALSLCFYYHKANHIIYNYPEKPKQPANHNNLSRVTATVNAEDNETLKNESLN